MCPKVSEKPMRACKGVILGVKLDIIVLIAANSELNKDLVCVFIWVFGNAQKLLHIN